MGMMGNPFGRSRAIAAAIMAAMLLPTYAEASAAMSGIAPYQSRGKGQGLTHNKHSRHTVAMDKRAAKKARNRSR